jgi:hypothetical protein
MRAKAVHRRATRFVAVRDAPQRSTRAMMGGVCAPDRCSVAARLCTGVLLPTLKDCAERIDRPKVSTRANRPKQLTEAID